jgi:glycosyltransferase involved in cell wall biosynthesis
VSTGSDSYIRIVQFAPLDWEELLRTGFRKTSGAMFKALRDATSVHELLYVQTDRRWGLHFASEQLDERTRKLGLPIGLPYERFDPIRTVNRKLQARGLLRYLSPDVPTVVWFYDWLAAELAQFIPADLRVMELTDSASQFFKESPPMLKRLPVLKEIVANTVDIIFAVSPMLAEEVRSLPCRVEVLPNGISTAFLTDAATLQSEPEELVAIPHPRLLVVGTGWSMNNRVDHQLLIAALDMLKEWHLILVGCETISSKGLRALTAHSRVTALPLVQQERLPAFIQYADVCAVPYVQGPALRDTLKAYEYLACGKPVVLTADKVREELERFVHYAHTAGEFASACAAACNGARRPELAAIHKILSEHTWDRRAQRALALCEEVMRGKG